MGEIKVDFEVDKEKKEIQGIVIIKDKMLSMITKMLGKMMNENIETRLLEEIDKQMKHKIINIIEQRMREAKLDHKIKEIEFLHVRAVKNGFEVDFYATIM